MSVAILREMPLDTQAAAPDCCEQWKGLIQTIFTRETERKEEGIKGEENAGVRE